MANKPTKQEFLIRRREYINKLRRNAAIFQTLAFLFLAVGLGVFFWTKSKDISNLYLVAGAIVVLLIGVGFEIAAIIYFSKTKKHISGQTVNASTDPRNWGNYR